MAEDHSCDSPSHNRQTEYVVGSIVQVKLWLGGRWMFFCRYAMLHITSYVFTPF